MELIGIKTPVIKPEDDLVEVILNQENEEITLENKDILAIASSVVSTVAGLTREIDKINPTDRAKKLAQESNIESKIAEIIIQESDKVLSPGQECVLTLKDEMLKVNAGVDRTNVPEGKVVLLPENPAERAKNIRAKLEEKTNKRLGVLIIDSHVNPLRMGTTGQALGSDGINELIDCRNQEDLFGRSLQITRRGIGDQMAAAAQLVMGETSESVPAVIIRGVKEAFSDLNDKSQKISPEECVYSKICDYMGEYE